MAYDGSDLPFFTLSWNIRNKNLQKLPSPYLYTPLCETTEEGFHDTLS